MQAELKASGDAHFKSIILSAIFIDQNYREAIKAYEGALSVGYDAHILCNKALCHFKLQEWDECLTASSAAIDLSSTYEKVFIINES